MRIYTDGFLKDDDVVQCWGDLASETLHMGDLRIFTDTDGLARIGAAIEDRLKEIAEPAPPIPAEAATGVTVDADDLFTAMAMTYHVRRGSWDGEGVTP